jgi:hypothetical protein
MNSETKIAHGLWMNQGGVRMHPPRPELSLLRMYALRIAYLILAAGLGVYVWPTVLHHTVELASTDGVRVSLLAGMGAMAVLGLRYPVQMLPLLLFELSWKVIYLTGFALPLWLSHQMTAAVEEDANSVLVVVILLPFIPWRYVFTHYVAKRGDRWTQDSQPGNRDQV